MSEEKLNIKAKSKDSLEERRKHSHSVGRCKVFFMKHSPAEQSPEEHGGFLEL